MEDICVAGLGVAFWDFLKEIMAFLDVLRKQLYSIRQYIIADDIVWQVLELPFGIF